MDINNSTMDINQLIDDSIMDYSAYVLLHRCLPDIRDGLKPIHRYILYTMWINKFLTLTKSANVTGAVMKFSPHGNSYDTVVNLVQKDKQLIPFIDGKGNFSQHTSRDLQYAAERYSEVKLSQMSIDMLSDLNKNMVEFIDNYDGTKKVPVYLPTKYPTILCYTNIGIGVGMSSTICSFNMNEVNDAVIDYIKTGNKVDLIPDLATGAYIHNQKDVIESINSSGVGTITLKSKIIVEKNIIKVLEIPYTTTREAIIDKIVKLVKDGKLVGITSVKDLTDLKGMCIEIVCRKNVDMDNVVKQLYSKTPMESTMSIQMRMLVDGLPKVLGVWQVIDEWLKFRRGCISRGLISDIESLTKRKHLLEGFKKVVNCISEVISVIRESEDDKVISNLKMRFDLDDIQANYIADIKLRTLNKQYILKQLGEYDNIVKTIKEYQDILKNDKKINDLIIKGLQETNKKYPIKRRTQIC